MLNGISDEQKSKTWLMYLRKSRQDDPNETVEEVLAKHETMLQEWARRELGREISEDCIHREVVSGGESISEREQMRLLLSRVEDPNVAGVTCVDPQRLTRGDLLDCGTLINTLMYTNTLVATPMMTYDLTNKMERRFFQDELMRGRDYLEYVKEVLSRGRLAAVKKGCFIGSKPPFGYDKVTIGKDHTLVPNKDAEVVRMIFDWYVNERLGYVAICSRLDAMGIKPVAADVWWKNSVANILQNVHYDGKICFYRKKQVVTVKNGIRHASWVVQPNEDMIIVEGKHPAIVDHDIFVEAQKIMNNNPRVNTRETLVNMFAGILTCSHCGRVLCYNRYNSKRRARLECRKKPHHFKSVAYDDVVSAVLFALENSELPNLTALRDSNAGNSAAIQELALRRLEEEMEDYRKQEETQYELLETRKYTQELFDRRNAILRQKMDDCEERIRKAKQAIPGTIDYEEKLVQLQDAIRAMKDDTLDAIEKNKLLKVIIERIVVTTTDQGVGNTDIGLQIYLRL